MFLKMLIMVLCFIVIETSAWAESSNPITINLPRYISDSQIGGSADFRIKNLRVCTASITSPAQHACPYPNFTDSSSGYNFTWACSSPNCLYTNIKQTSTAKWWASTSGNNILVGYGESQATMVPLLQAAIPTNWSCTVLLASYQATCSSTPVYCKNLCEQNSGPNSGGWFTWEGNQDAVAPCDMSNCSFQESSG